MGGVRFRRLKRLLGDHVTAQYVLQETCLGEDLEFGGGGGGAAGRGGRIVGTTRALWKLFAREHRRLWTARFASVHACEPSNRQSQ